MTRRRVATIAILLAVLGAAAPFAGRWLLRRWERNSILEGERLASANGCFGCHRPFGNVEIPNPKSRWNTVPALQGGNAAMYVSSRADVEEFIRFGAPKKWTDDATIRERLGSQHLRMPAFGDRLSDAEVAALVEFALAEGEFELPGGEKAQKGRELAKDNGCLSCHGVEGAGGIANPGSLGGFIPGFLGKNFTDLVADEAEFRDWVKFGTNRRLEKNPVVRYFWKRQRIQMPPFAEMLDDEDIGHLWAWVLTIREAEAARRKESK